MSHFWGWVSLPSGWAWVPITRFPRRYAKACFPYSHQIVLHLLHLPVIRATLCGNPTLVTLPTSNPTTRNSDWSTTSASPLHQASNKLVDGDQGAGPVKHTKKDTEQQVHEDGKQEDNKGCQEDETTQHKVEEERKQREEEEEEESKHRVEEERSRMEAEAARKRKEEEDALDRQKVEEEEQRREEEDRRRREEVAESSRRAEQQRLKQEKQEREAREGESVQQQELERQAQAARNAELARQRGVLEEEEQQQQRKLQEEEGALRSEVIGTMAQSWLALEQGCRNPITEAEEHAWARIREEEEGSLDMFEKAQREARRRRLEKEAEEAKYREPSPDVDFELDDDIVRSDHSSEHWKKSSGSDSEW